MARYSLILKDVTYIALAQEALKQGKTLGRYLNDLLNAKAESIAKGQAGGVAVQAICLVCGRPAQFEGHGLGQQKLFVCVEHRKNISGLPYKEVV